MDEMTSEHKTHDLSHGECAQCDDVLTQEKQDKAHSSVRVDVLNVEVSGSGLVIIGVGRLSCNVTAQAQCTILNFHF